MAVQGSGPRQPVSIQGGTTSGPVLMNPGGIKQLQSASRTARPAMPTRPAPRLTEAQRAVKTLNSFKAELRQIAGQGGNWSKLKAALGFNDSFRALSAKVGRLADRAETMTPAQLRQELGQLGRQLATWQDKQVHRAPLEMRGGSPVRPHEAEKRSAVAKLGNAMLQLDQGFERMMTPAQRRQVALSPFAKPDGHVNRTDLLGSITDNIAKGVHSELATAFSTYCVQEFNKENLDFLVAVERFKADPTAAAATAIADQFVRAGSTQEVNLSGSQRDTSMSTIAAALDRLPAGAGDDTRIATDIFDVAQQEIQKLMTDDTLSRFLNKNEW